ncbi:Peroxisomal membrane anchor protein (Pex14p) conserved region family protein [Aspergillus niger]|uniref:Peroxisomal membrane anchor protein (Pex14p) conserved region family protein n=1 Tax=Aspergillus niger TaxID=5061 RepID=A0A505ICA0_ASPNG|nr:Peroxisomal membrane anchor protein (Pex14p) conserved region family protein [Aspergillus niger]
MATAENHDDLEFYPAYCFKASPTHFTWVKMAAVDVLRLKRRPEFPGRSPPTLSSPIAIVNQSTYDILFSFLPHIHPILLLYHPKIYFYKNHPIQYISLLGLITSRTEFPTVTILTLDDSSGVTLDVVVQKATPNSTPSSTLPTSFTPTQHISPTTSLPLDISPYAPGTFAHLKGTISTFRGVNQLQLERVFPVRDTNAEMRFLDQRSRFLVEVLDVPWRG